MDKKIIIGSGLAGPLLAILLAKRNYYVDLYEKRPDLRVQNFSVGRSINLALSHRGIKALKFADVFDEIESELIPMKGRIIHNSNKNIEFQPYSIHKHEYINSVSRGLLNKILMTRAELFEKVKIKFTHSLKKVDDIKNELVFENGKRVKYSNHVFGADGTGSIIRKYIDEKVAIPSYYSPLDHNYKELHIAPDKNGDFQMDPNALHIWPREKFMLIALPNTDKSFTCTLFLPIDQKISFESLTKPKLVVDFFSKYFHDVVPLLENFPESFCINPIGKLATIYAIDWELNNQFCLIGDAAHAVVPFFGQGMNASFEDCEVLIKFLDEENGDWNGIFNKYNYIRKKDSDAIAKMALENYIEMRDLVSKKDFIQKKKIANILSNMYPDRFIPRYNMVSFTSIPYSEVYKRGEIQNKIIDQINPNNPNMKLAKQLIMEKLNTINDYKYNA